MAKEKNGAATLSGEALDALAGRVDLLATLPMLKQPAAALDIIRDLVGLVRALALEVDGLRAFNRALKMKGGANGV